MPVAKEVVPTIVETPENAFKLGLGIVTKMGVIELMNGPDNAINGSEQKQVTYDSQRPVTYNDSGESYIEGYPQSKNPPIAYQGGHTLPHDKALSFKMKEISPDFVPHAKGFIGKCFRNAF